MGRTSAVIASVLFDLHPTSALASDEQSKPAMSGFQRVSALSRTAWLIDAIGLLNDTASEMLHPFMSLVSVVDLMDGPKALGLIESVAEATSSRPEN